MCLRKATQSVSRTSLLHQTYRQSFKFATPRAIALIPTSLHRSLSYLPSLQKPTGILGMSRESKDIDSRQVGPAQKTDEQSINVENSIISKVCFLKDWWRDKYKSLTSIAFDSRRIRSSWPNCSSPHHLKSSTSLTYTPITRPCEPLVSKNRHLSWLYPRNGF